MKEFQLTHQRTAQRVIDLYNFKMEVNERMDDKLSEGFDYQDKIISEYRSQLESADKSIEVNIDLHGMVSQVVKEQPIVIYGNEERTKITVMGKRISGLARV